MTKFAISSKGGDFYGVYEGDTAEIAFRSMCEDAGATYGDETTGTEADWNVLKVIHDFSVGDRVEGGESDDYDTGTIDCIESHGAMVRWDSGVTSYAPAGVLRRA